MNSKLHINYESIADMQMNLIDKYLRNYAGQLLYKKNQTIASLWDYSAYFTAVVKAYKVNPTKNQKYLDKALLDLEWYKVTNRKDNHLVYASENGHETPVFYDDNVWLAIGFVELYEVTLNNVYLDKAKRILDFIYESWQTHDGGGLLWKEFPKTFKPEQIVRNTCINAPTAYVSSLIYKLTKEQTYLDWAVKIYGWTKNVLKDPNSGLYFDNISQNHIIEETYWTYNVGVMIATASILYHITEDSTYAQDALLSIKDSHKRLAIHHDTHQVDFKYYDDSPWFRVYLFQGLLDGYTYLKLKDKEIVEKYLDEVLYGFDYMYQNFQPQQTFVLDKWSKSNVVQTDVESLFASGNLESLYIFETYRRMKERGETK